MGAPASLPPGAAGPRPPAQNSSASMGDVPDFGGEIVRLMQEGQRIATDPRTKNIDMVDLYAKLHTFVSTTAPLWHKALAEMLGELRALRAEVAALKSGGSGVLQDAPGKRK